MPDSSPLKVSVWRPFVPSSPLLMNAPGTDLPTVRQLTDDTGGLQQEVFTWRMLEDPFGGIADANDRAQLKETLLTAMALDVPPQERSVQSLKNFIARATAVLDAGGVEWTGSQSSLTDTDEERNLNPLLALVNHLSWLVDVFDGQPNISVSVR